MCLFASLTYDFPFKLKKIDVPTNENVNRKSQNNLNHFHPYYKYSQTWASDHHSITALILRFHFRLLQTKVTFEQRPPGNKRPTGGSKSGREA